MGAVFLLATYLILAYYRGEDSCVPVSENLDGMVPLTAVLSRTGALFAGLNAKVPQVMNGIPRSSLPSEINLGVLLYHWLGPLPGFIANDVLMRLAAFVGMGLLLRRHVLPFGHAGILAAASLCFALLPFCPSGYFSVAGQPFLLWAILNLRQGRRVLPNLLFVIIFCLNSSFVLVGFLLPPALLALILWDWIRTRRLPRPLVWAMLLIAVLSPLTEYRAIHQTFFDKSYVTMRTEFQWNVLSLPMALARGARHLVWDDRWTQARSMHVPVILLAVLISACLTLLRGLVAEEARLPGPLRRCAADRPGMAPPRTGVLLALVLVNVVICGLYGLWHWEETQEFLQSGPLRKLSIFNLSRPTWFLPLSWAVVLALALDRILRNARFGRALAFTLIAAQLAAVSWNSTALFEQRRSGLTWRQFFATALMEDIQRDIGRPVDSYRVVSLGMMPSAALFNGFHVLDIYCHNYSLDYKKQFRRVIARELDKHPGIKHSFDTWGGWCYFYSAELGWGYAYTRDNPIRSVKNLEIDVAALKEMGGAYILSAVRIENAESLGIRLERIYERDDLPWQIHLYVL